MFQPTTKWLLIYSVLNHLLPAIITCEHLPPSTFLVSGFNIFFSAFSPTKMVVENCLQPLQQPFWWETYIKATVAESKRVLCFFLSSPLLAKQRFAILFQLRHVCNQSTWSLLKSFHGPPIYCGFTVSRTLALICNPLTWSQLDQKRSGCAAGLRSSFSALCCSTSSSIRSKSCNAGSDVSSYLSYLWCKILLAISYSFRVPKIWTFSSVVLANNISRFFYPRCPSCYCLNTSMLNGLCIFVLWASI